MHLAAAQNTQNTLNLPRVNPAPARLADAKRVASLGKIDHDDHSHREDADSELEGSLEADDWDEEQIALDDDIRLDDTRPVREKRVSNAPDGDALGVGNGCLNGGVHQVNHDGVGEHVRRILKESRAGSTPQDGDTTEARLLRPAKMEAEEGYARDKAGVQLLRPAAMMGGYVEGTEDMAQEQNPADSPNLLSASRRRCEGARGDVYLDRAVASGATCGTRQDAPAMVSTAVSNSPTEASGAGMTHGSTWPAESNSQLAGVAAVSPPDASELARQETASTPGNQALRTQVSITIAGVSRDEAIVHVQDSHLASSPDAGGEPLDAVDIHVVTECAEIPKGGAASAVQGQLQVQGTSSSQRTLCAGVTEAGVVGPQSTCTVMSQVPVVIPSVYNTGSRQPSRFESALHALRQAQDAHVGGATHRKALVVTYDDLAVSTPAPLSINSSPQKSVYHAVWRLSQTQTDGQRQQLAVVVLAAREATPQHDLLVKSLGSLLHIGPHAHIVPVLGMCERPPDGDCCLVMEYAAKGSLDRVLQNVDHAGANSVACDVLLAIAAQVRVFLNMLNYFACASGCGCC